MASVLSAAEHTALAAESGAMTARDAADWLSEELLRFVTLRE